MLVSMDTCYNCEPMLFTRYVFMKNKVICKKNEFRKKLQLQPYCAEPTMHEISIEFEIRPDQTTNCGVSYPLACEKIPIGLQWEQRCLHLFSAIYYPILMIRVGIENMHKSLDDFEFGQDLTTNCRVSCP